LIQRTRGLVLAVALTVVVALVVTFPARVAYRWMSPPFVMLSGISGTVWHGNAREFSTYGVYLRDLEWKIHPLKLLTGKAVYDVSGSPVSGFFESEMAVGIGGTMTLRNLTASIPLAMLERAAGVPGLRGNASLQFERMELVDGRASAMDGTLELSDVQAPMISRAALGGYRAEFFTQNNGISASVEDTDGVVDLAGSLQLNPDKSYAFLGVVSAKPGTPENIRQQMQYLPTTDVEGQRELRSEGTY